MTKHTLWPTLLLTLALATPTLAADTPERILIVRESHTATLLNGSFTLKLWKQRGYSVELRVNGEKRILKLGETLTPPGADCHITFEENSPETRLARFKTTCP